MKANQLTNREIDSFSTQMALVLHAGISAYEGIAIMNEDAGSEELKPVLADIYKHLENGESFHDALAATSAFPDYFLKMVQIGEMSGRLDEVMESLSVHYRRVHDNSESIKSAVTYPFVMIIMMLVVVGVLITQVLPIFNQVFSQLGSSITGFSKMVLDLGMTLSNYSYIFIGIIVVIMILFLYFTKSESGKTKLYNFFAKWRFTRKLSLKLALSQFTSGMSIALSSGLDIDQSLEMSKELINHKELMNKITKVQMSLAEKDLATSLVEMGVFNGMYARLVKIGNKTGHMDDIMREIADQYDRETNERILNLIGIIEPTLVAILSVLVGIILLSVMLPLIGIMSSL